MSISETQARALLKDRALRATRPRLAVVRALAEAETPLSYTEVLAHLGQVAWDPTTVYRNLIKLRDAGLASVVHRAEGIDRYALASGQRGAHRHPHFVCRLCGRVVCLPGTSVAAAGEDGPWTQAVRQASVQLRGDCPDCRAAGDRP